MLVRDEAVALGLARVLVGDDDGFVDGTVGGEERSELVGGCVGAKAADEELAAGGVGVGEGAGRGEEVGVVEEGGGEDLEEVVVR